MARDRVSSTAKDVSRSIMEMLGRITALVEQVLSGAARIRKQLKRSSSLAAVNSLNDVKAQLEHLVKMADQPNVTVQLVPESFGGHSVTGMPFTILRFAEPDLPSITSGPVKTLVNRQYFPEVMGLFNAATQRIKVVMYGISYSPKYAGSKVNQLVEALVAARARGVDTGVVIDLSDYNALLNKVNEILRSAKQDGTLESYSQKWLGRGTGNLPD